MNSATASRVTEAGWGALLLALGLLPRLAMALVHPVQPISDFAGIVQFALFMRDHSIAAPGYYWDVFNVGPPLLLSLLLRLWPSSPVDTARLATVLFTGVTPLLPFLIWRRAAPLWVRVLAGALLALWPGQVLFSGVVAQDNWAMPPTVAVCALAARALILRRGYPLAAGLAFAVAVAMRQEMLYVLALPLLAAAGIFGSPGRKVSRLAVCALAIGVPFGAMALQRRAATGHLSLGSGHLGYTLLGTVRPGATRLGWDDPVSYVAAVAPELLSDRRRLFGETLPLALAEVRRRPAFQALRVLAGVLRTPFRCDADNLYWSLTAAGVQPPGLVAVANARAAMLWPLLIVEMSLVQALFLAALTLALWQRDAPTLIVGAAALLKILLHAVLVPAGRFLVPAVALELLVIALGCWLLARSWSWRRAAIALAAGSLGAAALLPAGRALSRYVQDHDPVDAQLTYRFSLTGAGHQGVLDCVVRRGRVVALGPDFAALELLHERPTAGEGAAADCVVRGSEATAEQLAVAIDAPLGAAAAPGTVVQRVVMGGRVVLSRDASVAEQDGMAEAAVGLVGAGERHPVRVEVLVREPMALGAARTVFRLVRDPTVAAAGPGPR